MNTHYWKIQTKRLWWWDTQGVENNKEKAIERAKLYENPNVVYESK